MQYTIGLIDENALSSSKNSFLLEFSDLNVTILFALYEISIDNSSNILHIPCLEDF